MKNFGSVQCLINGSYHYVFMSNTREKDNHWIRPICNKKNFSMRNKEVKISKI